MFPREGIFRNAPRQDFLRFRRLWICVLVVGLLQGQRVNGSTDHVSTAVTSQKPYDQSQHPSSNHSSLHSSAVQSGHHSSWTQASNKKTQNSHARHERALFGTERLPQSTFNTSQGRNPPMQNISQLNRPSSSSYSSPKSTALNSVEGTKTTQASFGTSNVTFSLDVLPLHLTNVTNSSLNVTNVRNVTHSLNDSNSDRKASFLELSKHSNHRATLNTNDTEYKLEHSSHLPERIILPSAFKRGRNYSKIKEGHNLTTRKIRRKSSTLVSDKNNHHRHYHRRHRFNHQHLHSLQGRKFALPAPKRKTKSKNLNKGKRSLEVSSRILPNGGQALFRDSGEQILLRFKRKSLLDDKEEKEKPQRRKRSKKRKRQQTPFELGSPRSVAAYRSQTPLSNGDYTTNVKSRLKFSNAPYTRGVKAQNTGLSQPRYGPLVNPAKGSKLSLYPYGLAPDSNGYKRGYRWGGNVWYPFQLRGAVNLKNFRQFVPPLPISTFNAALNRNQFTRKGLRQEIPSPVLPNARTQPQRQTIYKTMPQNIAFNSVERPYTKVKQPMNLQYPNKQAQIVDRTRYNVLSRKQLIPSEYGTFAASQRRPYALARESINVNPVFNPQAFGAKVSAQYRTVPQRTGLNSFYPVSSASAPHLLAEGELSRRSHISPGLLVYLDFEGGESGEATTLTPYRNVAELGKRTEITKSFGSCGKVARLRNGSEILLNGKQMKVKPRQAVTIATWIRLDTNKGFHSIFDTVGSHSLHRDGQYHFEVQDGRARWFHRNETANQIFSVETDPIIPANVWTHVVGTYDSRTGEAKVFVNGKQRAEAHGKGLLSQDWDAHAGIGKHKDQRFLEGEVDEFRIYNKALTEGEIQQLTKLCSFITECGGKFSSPSGMIESPDWPNGYRGKSLCKWTINAQPGEIIILRFRNFSLEQDGSCDRARLVVKDGQTERNDELGFYCGQKSPTVLASSGNSMWLQFASNEWAEGKGFHLEYNTGAAHQTKKQETPANPYDDSQRCAVTRPEYNVTLIGGIKSGTFSEARHVHDMDLCTRHCCLRKPCDLAFMIRETCYLVDCTNEELCKPKKARPSAMNPRISYVSHLQAASLEPEISSAGSAYDKSLASPTTIPTSAQPRCHHTAPNYNVTLVGGINAGKFSTYGRTSTLEECTRHCCHDDNCDLAFMIQGNCYTVECADAEGCQVKKAKPSNYNPTVAFVYRGNGKPIGEPLPGADRPSLDACKKSAVSETIYNVTLSGGMKAGNFTDKGVVASMRECSAYCCADETCNVAFLIRDNCFLVACKDYESCQVKPALSKYYHPRLAYVNWSPPDDEIPANRWYASLGCWKDTEAVAVHSLEGSDDLLSDSYIMRDRPIDKCAQVARKHAYKVFAIQNGGACLGGPTAGRMFNQYGESSLCKAGRGGLFANDVYRLTDSGSYISLGCWNDSHGHALPFMQHAEYQLSRSPRARSNPLRKCGDLARSRSYTIFAIGDGGMCLGGPRAEIDYKKYGISRRCRNGFGGPYSNSVYRLIDNLDLEIGTTEITRNATSPPPLSSSTGSRTSGLSSEFTPTSVTSTPGTLATSPSPTTQLQENYITLQDGLPRKNSYTASDVKYNVTLKYGIKAGKFNDKGKVGNMSDCVRACGRMSTCSLAFMLGKQCFAVSCYNSALCKTKPAFSQFYRPKIAFIKHEALMSVNKTALKLGQCRTSEVHNDVTLVGGISAGKFSDLGDVDNMAACTKRCCMKDSCDVAFMLENECYGVSCINDSVCETRPARNPERYHPKIAYVYHNKRKDKAATPSSNVCWDGEILYNHTLVGGINAGTFTDNGKTGSMDLCMQFCCKRPSCDLAFMIEDDCYSVACLEKDGCEPRKARPTHYFPRIALRKKTQGDNSLQSTPDTFSSTPITSSTPSTPSTPETPLTSQPTTASPTTGISAETAAANAVVNLPVHVAHSCDATTIEHNVTLKMGLHSGVFQKIGKVDSMDDCIEMCCKQPNSDVAFMLGSMCYTVHCYSADLCKTVPIFASSISRLNLNPAISFLRKKNRFRVNSLATQNDGIPQDTCRESTITYNVTLRGGIDAGNFTERPGTQTMRECIGNCCDDATCDLAFMFGEHCYSVECKGEKLCQAVLAKPSRLEPKISYVARTYMDEKDKGTIFSASDETPTCRADQKSRSKVVSNKTLVGGLEAGKFNFLGVVRNMDMCMDRCCARRGCNVAYMVDRNCFSVSCYSPSLCKISDVASTNGNVEISTIMESTAKTTPEESHSMLIYVIIGVVGFAAGAGGIVWAVCMFLRRHRLRSRHRQDTE